MRFSLITCAAIVFAAAAIGQTIPAPAAAGRSVPAPPLPPVALDFRQLLAMTPAEREKTLAARSPQDRQLLEAKLKEYDSLSPEEREARLKSLQLRLYLRPLMKMDESNRVERLATIPEADREMITKRLKLWDQLSPELQKQFLDNEVALRILLQPELAVPIGSANQSLSDQRKLQIEKAIERWRLLPDGERRRIHEHFQLFFELDEEEKNKRLEDLNQDERRQIERTVRIFERLPAQKREACLAGLERFTQLSRQEREQFLKNAQLWQNLSPDQRKLCRELVMRYGVPQPPPLPSAPTRTPAVPTQFTTNN